MYYKRAVVIVILVLLSISVSLFLVGEKQVNGTFEKSDNTDRNDLFYGVWINYIEFADMINGKNEEQYRGCVTDVVKNVKSTGFNTVVLHIRSHCDAFYPSDIFPFSSLISTTVEFDPLYIFLEIAHDFNIQVQGWINPYRVAKSTSKIDDLRENSPAIKLYNEGGVSVIDSGIYLIPSETKVQKLIIDGVRELLQKYALDGIHFDDYFYPDTREDFDKSSYEKYKKIAGQNALDLDDFRRQSVNSLILGVYQAVKSHNQNIAFGISPSADIEKNYNTLYADLSRWIEGGYVDYICPQLYFGFEYPKENFQFENLLSEWENLCKNKVKMVVGLAAYKSGKVDAGSDEWVKNNDILSRQAEIILQNKNLYGICVYNYSSFFSATKERGNLCKIISHIP